MGTIKYNLFDYLYPQFKIKNKIRLIELFAGIGSQAMALRDLGADFEHYRAVEFDKYAIKSYNAIHDTNFSTLDIRDIHADDLGIVDKDQYCYIMTYSFPCQDLSLAGKRKGMKKGSGTRSGLLWEVERILDECTELPQVLLMENVPEVIGKKNIDDFKLWQLKLEQMGYTNFVQILNAKDYGIPQNRNRCFMVSLLGKWNYRFPKKRKLNLRLKDVLESDVDEKYYLSDKLLKNFTDMTNRNGYVRGEKFKPLTESNEYAYSITTHAGSRATDNFIIVPNPKIVQIPHGYNEGGIKELCPSLTKSSWQTNNFLAEPVICASRGRNPENPRSRVTGEPTEQRLEVNTKGLCNALTSVQKDNLVLEPKNDMKIRRLTPLECWRLMGFTDEDFRKAEKINSNTQLYKQAGNSIVKQVLMGIFKEMM